MATQRVEIPISFEYTDGSGKLIPIPAGTALTILDRVTGNPAVIFANLTGGTTIVSPVTDASGNVPGCVVEGSYSITAAANLGATPPFSGATINWEAVRGDGVENIFAGAVNAAAIASGAVDLTKLTTAVAQALVPTGTIFDFAGSTAPAGYHLCDGSVQSQSGTFAALFAVVGTTYNTGGEGGGNFRLPDTRQRFTLGKSASGTGATLGSTGGSIDHTHSIPGLSIPALTIPGLSIPVLGVITAIAAHTHSLSNAGSAYIFVSSSSGNQLNIAATQVAGGSGPAAANFGFAVSTNRISVNSGTTDRGVPLGGNTDTGGAAFASGTTATGTTGTAVTGTGTSGTGTSGATNPPYLTTNKIIKL